MARGVSETRILRNIRSALTQVLERGRLSGVDAGMIGEAVSGVELLLAQVERGVHVNPALLVYGNPGRCLSKDVLAILYRHAEDGKEYCHGFGDADIRLSSRGDAVTIQGLKRRTGVGMYAGKDGETVTLRKPGVRLVEDF